METYNFALITAISLDFIGLIMMITIQKSQPCEKIDTPIHFPLHDIKQKLKPRRIKCPENDPLSVNALNLFFSFLEAEQLY